MPEITRTVKLKVNIPLDAARRTVEAWTAACNAVSRIAFENGRLSNAIRLQKLSYDTAKSAGLSAQVAVSCIRHVASKYAAARSNKHALIAPAVFRSQAVILQGGKRGRDVAIRSSGLSVWTADGRFKAVPFSGPPGLADKIANWTFGDGRLMVIGKSVFLTLSFKRDVEERTAPNDAVVGVDRGINVLACATDGSRHWMRKGSHTKHVRDRYLHIRSSLQRKKAESPTRSVAKTLKRLSGREKRFMQAVNHEVSKSVVTFAERAGCPVIAVEQLDGIRGHRLRKKVRREVQRWAYGQLAFFIGYKAAERGMTVIEVDPRGTSTGCSRCGHTAGANRKRHAFECRACGHKLHSDLNAAHNIRLRGILARQVLRQDGPPSCGPEVRPIDPGWKPGEGTDKPSALADGS
ncbi:MAG: transposase [Hyphomicrobiales bacterium]|nr:transposase [Hyphomicrobiales bacterium]